MRVKCVVILSAVLCLAVLLVSVQEAAAEDAVEISAGRQGVALEQWVAENIGLREVEGRYQVDFVGNIPDVMVFPLDNIRATKVVEYNEENIENQIGVEGRWSSAQSFEVALKPRLIFLENVQSKDGKALIRELGVYVVIEPQLASDPMAVAAMIRMVERIAPWQEKMELCLMYQKLRVLVSRDRRFRSIDVRQCICGQAVYLDSVEDETLIQQTCCVDLIIYADALFGLLDPDESKHCDYDTR